MKAAIWTSINKIEIGTIPTPTPKISEVLVKVKVAGVCATDVHMIIGHVKLATPPHVLGHKIAGEIAQIGDGVKNWNIGDRVIINTFVSCGECVFCKSGRREMCKNGKEIGYPPYNGGYAEDVVVPYECLILLNDKITYGEGAIIESILCPSSAIFKHGIKMGSTVFIQGAGPAGTAYIKLAKTCGAGKVIISARGKERLEYARQFGSDIVINAGNEDVIARVFEKTDGLGAEML